MTSAVLYESNSPISDDSFEATPPTAMDLDQMYVSPGADDDIPIAFDDELDDQLDGKLDDRLGDRRRRSTF